MNWTTTKSISAPYTIPMAEPFELVGIWHDSVRLDVPPYMGQVYSTNPAAQTFLGNPDNNFLPNQITVNYMKDTDYQETICVLAREILARVNGDRPNILFVDALKHLSQNRQRTLRDLTSPPQATYIMNGETDFEHIDHPTPGTPLYRLIDSDSIDVLLQYIKSLAQEIRQAKAFPEDRADAIQVLHDAHIHLGPSLFTMISHIDLYRAHDTATGLDALKL